MTTISTAPAGTLGAPTRAAAPAPTTGIAPLGAIDPIRLLNKHKWLLVAAAVIGAGLGTAAHFTLRRLYPQWRPIALFQCLPAQQTASEMAPQVNTDEMSRFMQTQLRLMTSDTVYARVAEDPALQGSAPNWSKYYEARDAKTGVPKFDSVECAQDLKDYVSARVIAQTTLIELSVRGADRYETTAVLA